MEVLDPLPVCSIAVPVEPVLVGTGPAALVEALTHWPVLPVVDATGRLIHIFHEATLFQPELQPEGGGGEAALDSSLPLLVLDAQTTVGEARALFEKTPVALLPLVEEAGRYTGFCASRRALLKLLHGRMAPPRIGGLATPLGVYMTSGVYSSGAGWKGLVATGALFALLVFGLERGVGVLFQVLETVGLPISQWPAMGVSLVESILTLLLFLLVIRWSPLSGLHAAEHMTISAIEHDRPINPHSVRTQPREHVRCGTNLMVLLIGIQAGLILLESLRPVIPPWVLLFLYLGWMWAVMAGWRPLGLWIQTVFTTKPPTDLELESGMKAGRELLEKFRLRPHAPPTLWRRIWGAGLLQIIATFIVVRMGLLWLEAWIVQ